MWCELHSIHRKPCFEILSMCIWTTLAGTLPEVAWNTSEQNGTNAP